MPLMTQIRNNLSKAFAVFAALFVVYIVLDWGMDLTGRRSRSGGADDTVGKVNGQKIGYREFSELVHQAVENHRNQTKIDPDEETERLIRTQVWNDFINQSLVQQAIDRLGVTVTDQEIIDLVHGPTPPDFLVNQFKDSTGKFNRGAYDRAISDPRNRVAWVQVEQVLRRQREREKLQSLLYASVRVTEGEIKQRFLDQNSTLEADYILFDPNRMVSDSAVNITDDDLQQYYNSHQDEFKIRANRKLKYVFFSQAPSAEDSAAVLSELTRLLEQATGGIDFMELAKTYSETPVNEAFFKHGELGRAKENEVFSAKKGAIVGPIKDFDGLHLMKILDERQGSAQYVRASHILLNAISGPDSVKKIQKAHELLKRIRSGEDFAKLARENSEDVGSASQGGDLGWTGKGGWVKPFEDAAWRAGVGQVVGPVRSQFGWHIIKVTGKDTRELKLAVLTMKVKPSSQTLDAARQRADDFAYLSKSEGFEQSAETSGYEVRETQEFTKGSVIPAIGFNDAVMNFAFSKKLGFISDPLAIRSGLAVFKISHVQDEGVRPLDEVKGIVRLTVLRQKKLQRIRDQVYAFHKTLQPGTDLPAAARSLQNVTAQKTGPFKPAEGVGSIGRDPAFSGVALALKPDEISKPFEGLRGYFIVKLTSKSEFDSTKYASQRANLQEQILQEKRNRLMTDWTNGLRGKADIEDHRDKFFR